MSSRIPPRQCAPPSQLPPCRPREQHLLLPLLRDQLSPPIIQGPPDTSFLQGGQEGLSYRFRYEFCTRLGKAKDSQSFGGSYAVRGGGVAQARDDGDES